MNAVKRLVTSTEFNSVMTELRLSGFEGNTDNIIDYINLGTYVCESSKKLTLEIIIELEENNDAIECWLCFDTYESGIKVPGGDNDFFFNNKDNVCFEKILDSTYRAINQSFIDDSDIAPEPSKYDGNAIHNFALGAVKVLTLVNDFNSNKIKLAA